MNKKVVLAFSIMFLITIGVSVCGTVLSDMEPTHFRFAVPAGNVTKPITLRGAGPPITLTPIRIDIDQFTPLKKLLNPNAVRIATHWIYNLGKKPVRIHLELVNCNIPVEWSVSANYPYDEKTHTFTKPLMPGKSIDGLVLDWTFEIPPYYMDEPIIYHGGLKITDADTGDLLTFIPIDIVRGGVGQSKGGAGCCS